MRTGKGFAYLVLGLALGVPVAGGAAASGGHHGTAASYDQETWITVEGVVSEFLWRNPHSSLYLDLTDEQGNVSEYAIELASPGLMVRQGWNRNIFKPGDHIVFRVHPSRAGTPVGECLFECEVRVNGDAPDPERR